MNNQGQPPATIAVHPVPPPPPQPPATIPVHPATTTLVPPPPSQPPATIPVHPATTIPPPAIASPPPAQPPVTIAAHPSNVPSPPTVPSDEWLEGLLEEAQEAVEGEEEKRNTGEVMEWQPTVGGEKDEENLISSQESVAMQLEPKRAMEENILSSQKEGKQPEASLLPGATTTAPPLPEPSHGTATDLLQLCIYNIAVCVVRCPAYYKPRYRLAAVLAEIGQTEVTKHTQ